MAPTKVPDEELRLDVLSGGTSLPQLTLRVWWREGSTWHPSKNGLDVPVSSLPELRAALMELEAEALKRRQLEPADFERAGLPVPEELA